jgi:hypothetical protein
VTSLVGLPKRIFDEFRVFDVFDENGVFGPGPDQVPDRTPARYTGRTRMSDPDRSTPGSCYTVGKFQIPHTLRSDTSPPGSG